MDDNLKTGFQALENEVSIPSLPIRGKIPAWLKGVFIRNGFAKWDTAKQKGRHWFDGFAMLHSFNFEDGKVSYANKFLRSLAYVSAMQTGKYTLPEFATEPSSSYLGRVYTRLAQKFTDNAPVNVAKIGERFIALTESPLRVAFDPLTLKTLGPFHFADNLTAHLSTAHPHLDYDTGEMIGFNTRFSLKNAYDIFRIKNGTKKRELILSVKADNPCYMHTFALTKNYIILTEFPLVINPLHLVFSGKPMIDVMQWKPKKGTRFIVIGRKEGKIKKIYMTNTCFCFHHINAFEDEDGIVVDLVAYKDASIVPAGYLNRLLNNPFMPTGEIRRYYLPVSKNGDICFQILTDAFVEYPRIYYEKYNTKKYNIVYGISSNLPNGFLNQLKKIYLSENKNKSWTEKGCYAGEPVFVPKPNESYEDDGVVLSVVLDTIRKFSFLLILDAQTFTEIARAELPHAIPFGTHGQFYPM